MKHKSFSYLYKIVMAICFLVVTNSCTDFLKEQAPSNLTPDNFYSIPDHTEAAIASVYADLRFMGGGAGIFSSNWQLLEALTGTSTTETAQNSDLNNLYGLVHDGNTIHVRNY
jgi:starch-binding outer membrane protein, SusD/RagB family